jgi:hypothetical protein
MADMNRPSNKSSHPHYTPDGNFSKRGKLLLTDKEKQAAFVRAEGDKYIMTQVDDLAGYLPEFGISAAKELVLMLTAWLEDHKDSAEAQHYLERLKKET